MYQRPEKSPWGEVETCDVLCPGVFLVSTASHGGTLVSNEVSAMLSPAAQKCGFRHGGYLCFEEDSQESIVLRELLDTKLWAVPARIKTTRTIGGSDRPEGRKFLPGRLSRLTMLNADTSGQLGPKSERRILPIGLCKRTK